ncbi:MAG: GDP-mannose 4,6-dehydratase, partial [bacterium]|nr:GDP-mannose 4,6-dehydratase [bacterium]
YSLFACTGILFNHESPLRPERFVTRKIISAACRIAAGSNEKLQLGNISIARDWGLASEYVDAMWRMLQQDSPEDYVIATGETHSVREFCELAFGHVGLRYEDFVRTNPKLVRPAEVDLLVGDASKAWERLGWKPQVRFEELVRRMVEADLTDLKRGASDYPRREVNADRRAEMRPVIVAAASAPQAVQV